MRNYSISTLHYRFHRLELSYFEDLFEEVLKKLNITEEEILELMIVDGIGFGYDEKERLNWMRGKRIREVSSYAKVELIVGRKRDGRNIILNVKLGPAYSDERKLLKEIIGEIKVKSKYLLGDALYGMDIELLRLFLDKSEEVITPIKDTLHRKVKNPVRKKVKEMYEANKEKYKERYIVEQVIGKIKNAYRRCERTKGMKWRRKVFG